ncbi:DEAD/DEAH box helicase [Aquirufa echingensis]|uniref:DEAD/DEAH box helicase n=1 Tax=Aquirufa echingensis TaxID=3096516 RepID=A0ABW6D2T8_9BACT
MAEVNDEFFNNIKAGFIEKSIESSGEYIPRLLTNERSEGVKVLSSIIAELNSCQEFWFSVAFLTNGGLQSLLNTFKELQNQQIKGRILVSQYLNFTQPEALKRLLKFKNIELRINTNDNFHSKGYLFKKGEYYNLIIGSSNLTATALSTNKELNLKVSAKIDSYIIQKALLEFNNDFNSSIIVDEAFIDQYEAEYENSKNLQSEYIFKQIEITPAGKKKISPNVMQVEALANLKKLRSEGNDKALLISATGTGKTYLSAFDAKEFNPKRLLFVVHRANIAEATHRTFEQVFGFEKEMGFYSGTRKEAEKDFIFSTIQTISKEENMSKFSPDHFDYIIIDESHRAGADSYLKIVNYFNPKFLLGMTATPERTDGFDIFSLYDHNIAYEIRLQKALEIEILSPFHYFGVTDLTINGQEVEEKSDFNLLTSNERVTRIIEQSQFYSCDDGNIRGLVFCSKVEEAKALSEQFERRGFKSIALSGESSDEQRNTAIDRLESDDPADKIDYIFTVDIFNEGIDIPRVNQVIMLRPTQSAIIFVQQLGRGLRKSEGKEYLTVIDFIGNYSNNFLIPIALFGDTSYNKDNLRKLIAGGSNQIPGTSTINFDKIAKEKIYAAIDQSNFSLKKDLIKDYDLLKYKIGQSPMMLDFLHHGSRDPFLYVEYSGSYFQFVSTIEPDLAGKLSSDQLTILKLFSLEVNNAKRAEESELLYILLTKNQVEISKFSTLIYGKYGFKPTIETINSVISNLNFYFINKRNAIKGLGSNDLVNFVDGIISISEYFKKQLSNPTFHSYLLDSVYYGITRFEQTFDLDKYLGGFLIHHKYSRKDICRILNWKKNEESTMYGYSIKNSTCPIFVNYHKDENIAASTKFEDKFINNSYFQWFSKPRRNLDSPDVTAIKNHKNELRLSLFIKKSNGEGSDFYYMGDVKPVQESFEETTILDDHGKSVSVVKVIFKLNQPVQDSLYDYLTK